MASSKRTAAPRRASNGRQRQPEQSAWPAPLPSRAELAGAFSQVLDLAEGRALGHAARICDIALSLARAIRLPAEEIRTTFYAALLHDAGAAPASAEICRVANLTEEAIFDASEKSPQELALEIAASDPAAVVDVLHAHPDEGARVARDLGLEPAVQKAVSAHHERWDGRGYPTGLKGEKIPVASRIIAVADFMESVISSDDNALAARRNLLAALAKHEGGALEPELVRHAREQSRSDAFWLGLHSDDLPKEVSAACPEELTEETCSPAVLRTFATIFASLADTKGEHTKNHGPRTADLAVEMADELGFTAGRREMVYIAATLHNIGLLGVPARIMAKPDILSLTEMQEMRQHPTYSQMVLESLPGLDEIASWAGAHHERPDGKGYPEMLEAETIPIEARIIALADTYIALTSPRPYRKALSSKDAHKVLLGGAGTQLDRKLVQLFRSRPSELTSSRSAPRSRRKR